VSALRRLWGWVRGLRPWQQILLAAAVGFALLKAWDLAGLLLAGALDVDRIAGRARGAARSIRAAGRRAKGVSRTAEAAGDLLDSLEDLRGDHAEADASAEAELDEARAKVTAAERAVDEARHAEPPADESEPVRSRYLDGDL